MPPASNTATARWYWTTPTASIYSSWPGSSPGSASIAIAPLGPGKATVLDLKGVTPLGVVDGTLVYVTAAGVMMGAPIDVAKRRLLGPPVQLIDNVSINLGTGLARASLSSTGTLFYQSGSQLSRIVVAGATGTRGPARRPPRLRLPPTLPGRPDARPHHWLGRSSGHLAGRARPPEP